MNRDAADRLSASIAAFEAATGQALERWQREMLASLLAHCSGRPTRVILWPRQIGRSTLRKLIEQEQIKPNATDQTIDP